MEPLELVTGEQELNRVRILKHRQRLREKIVKLRARTAFEIGHFAGMLMVGGAWTIHVGLGAGSWIRIPLGAVMVIASSLLHRFYKTRTRIEDEDEHDH